MAESNQDIPEQASLVDARNSVQEARDDLSSYNVMARETGTINQGYQENSSQLRGQEAESGNESSSNNSISISGEAKGDVSRGSLPDAGANGQVKLQSTYEDSSRVSDNDRQTNSYSEAARSELESVIEFSGDAGAAGVVSNHIEKVGEYYQEKDAYDNQNRLVQNLRQEIENGGDGRKVVGENGFFHREEVMLSDPDGNFDPNGTSITIKDVYGDGLYERTKATYSDGISDDTMRGNSLDKLSLNETAPAHDGTGHEELGHAETMVAHNDEVNSPNHEGLGHEDLGEKWSNIAKDSGVVDHSETASTEVENDMSVG